MKAKHLSLRGLAAWFAATAVILGGFGRPIQAKLQEPAAQDTQDKKDEKKGEKKDEKKGLPLKPTRKIEFTTDEGTWLSLDVSPDGKTIAFELVGDIYTLPIEGGTAKLIDRGMAFDSQPKFSPDGKWIAFISDREGSENIWIMHPDGSGVKQVSKDPNSEFVSPSWSPDGNYIFVSKAAFGIGSSEVWMYHVNGGSGVQITKSKPTPTTKRARPAERNGCCGVAGRKVPLLRDEARISELQRAISHVAYCAARQEDGRRRRHHQSAGERVPASTFAGWKGNRVCDPIRNRNGPASAKSGDWGRPLDKVSRDARRPGIAFHSRRFSGICISSGREGNCLQPERKDLPAEYRDWGGECNSIYGAGVARDRTETGFSATRRARPREGAPDSGRC